MEKQQKRALINLQSQRTILITAIASIITAIMGITFIFISVFYTFNAHEYSPWINLIGELGSLLFVSVAIAFIWEFVGKKSFVSEIYSKFDIAKSLQSSGLGEIVFHVEEINWAEMFKQVKEIDLFFAYNIQWRSTNEVRLREFVTKEHMRLRVVLPDISDSILVESMARKFNKSPERFCIKVEEAIEEFTQISRLASLHNSSVEIWLHSMSFQYSLYRFDDTFIFALYNQQNEKTDVPHFVFDKTGDLAKFFEADLKFLISSDGSKKIL